jgi:hypothetical protein
MSASWSPNAVRPGDALLATTATGEERECAAASGYEGTHGRRADGSYGRIHDFPVIWIRFPGRSDRLPWPVEDLRSVGGGNR